MPMIKILFFGRLSDAAQPMDCELPKGVSTAGELAIWLEAQKPLLDKGLSDKGVRIAVNQIMTPRSATIKDGDEIAFMSPLSGG